MAPKTVVGLERVVVRFAGDSGDGMQLTGDRFTNATAIVGNDLATLPDFPAEIRAPAGTLAGVSAFQIHFASKDIVTPGDAPDVLVAMNPAALKANIRDLEKGGVIIANEDAFVDRNLEKAGYPADPLSDGTLDGYQVYKVPMTSITLRATEGTGISKKEAERAKNMFALGLISWMYSRPTEVTTTWLEKKFQAKPEILMANLAAFRAGYNFGETTELFAHTYEVKPAPAAPGTYRNVNGTSALSWGLIAASVKSGLPIFYASYPITPASEILHELSRHKNFGVRTLQSEDEIAAAGAALGASFGGHLGITGTSGPGLDLKQETIGLAVTLELPMIIVDVQRAGPSTGMPTKTEAADLLAAMYGRHGESPIPIVASRTPSECFDAAIEAVRIAVKYRTPVILLSDTFLANSSEPWRLPDLDALPDIDPKFATQPNHDDGFMPYLRDDNLARPWAVPGTPGLIHRIGGLEKEDVTGNISYDSANHERMTHLRAAKVARIAEDIPLLEVDDPSGDAELLVLGWGSTYGAILAGVRRVRDAGKTVASAHIRHLNPLPRNTADVLRSYPKVLIPEVNMGQLWRIVRADFLVDAESFSKVQGQPIFAAEIEREILGRL
ncbi:MAG TPA: 2-oxoacid:acceptor oxidoreductase subunit alpha [Actinomycetota bacterium]|nr:2-oxoacid:acceptor oxidoreductase subunit alpha [Actinomycetota bacterium]